MRHCLLNTDANAQAEAFPSFTTTDASSISSILSTSNSIPKVKPLWAYMEELGIGARSLDANGKVNKADLKVKVKMEPGLDSTLAEDDMEDEMKDADHSGEETDSPSSHNSELDDDDEDYAPTSRNLGSRRHQPRPRIPTRRSVTTKSGRAIKRKIVASDEEGEDDWCDEDGDDELDGDADVGGRSKTGRSSRQPSVARSTGGATSIDCKQRRSKMPWNTTKRLRAYFVANIIHPFPKDHQKRDLATEVNLNFKQVSDWFTNTRKRFWRPYHDYLTSIGCTLVDPTCGVCTCTSDDGSTKKKVGGAGMKNKRQKTSANEFATTGDDIDMEDGADKTNAVDTKAGLSLHYWWQMWD